MNREGPSTENQKGLSTLLSTHDYIPLVLETKEENGGGAIEGSGESAPCTTREDERERPFLQEENSDQFLGEPINLLQSISVFFHISHGWIEELTGLLREMSGTPITMEMTCKWLDLEPHMKEIPHDSLRVHSHYRVTQCLPQKGTPPPLFNIGCNTTEMGRGHGSRGRRKIPPIMGPRTLQE